MTYTVGDIVAERSLHTTRDALVKYAGASGDFNPIHYRDDIAASVGLPGVLAHGMLTMGIAVGTIISALGDSARIRECGVRFTRPVVVDAVNGADIDITAKVAAITDEAIRIDLTVVFEGKAVLGKAQVFVAPEKD